MSLKVETQARHCKLKSKKTTHSFIHSISRSLARSPSRSPVYSFFYSGIPSLLPFFLCLFNYLFFRFYINLIFSGRNQKTTMVFIIFKPVFFSNLNITDKKSRHTCL